jgi:hypothetical protein
VEFCEDNLTGSKIWASPSTVYRRHSLDHPTTQGMISLLAEFPLSHSFIIPLLCLDMPNVPSSHHDGSTLHPTHLAYPVLPTESSHTIPLNHSPDRLSPFPSPLCVNEATPSNYLPNPLLDLLFSLSQKVSSSTGFVNSFTTKQLMPGNVLPPTTFVMSPTSVMDKPRKNKKFLKCREGPLNLNIGDGIKLNEIVTMQ